MANTTAASQVALLTSLPAPSAPVPQLASGTVSVFVDGDWNSARFDISTSEYESGQRQTMQNLQDGATWLAFNLPIGVVMTMTNNVVANDKPVADLSDCGQTVDLVGTGQTQGVDLGAIGMNDMLSAFFWRNVDLDMGAIELFENDNFNGVRKLKCPSQRLWPLKLQRLTPRCCIGATIFLSEWSPNTWNSIDSWWLQDAITSIRWHSLNDRQTAALSDNSDGSGNQYDNIKGFGLTKEVANFGDFGVNDVFSAFRWNAVNPVKEIIAPFTINTSSASGSFGVTASHQQTNTPG